MSTPARSFLIVAVTAILLGGCGTQVTRTGFIDRADQICTSTLRQIDSLPPPATGGSPRQELQSLSVYLGHAVPLMRAQARQLRALPRPSLTELQARDLGRYLKALDRADQGLAELTKAAGRGDRSAVGELESGLSNPELDTTARAFGLKVCGSLSGTVR